MRVSLNIGLLDLEFIYDAICKSTGVEEFIDKLLELVSDPNETSTMDTFAWRGFFRQLRAIPLTDYQRRMVYSKLLVEVSLPAEIMWPLIIEYPSLLTDALTGINERALREYGKLDRKSYDLLLHGILDLTRSYINKKKRPDVANYIRTIKTYLEAKHAE
jgi:hypothetical protein